MIAYVLTRILGKGEPSRTYNVNEVLIIEGTLNQKKSLFPVYNNLNRSSYTLLGQEELGEYLPWQGINTYTCIYILTFLFNYWLSTKKEKKIIRSYLDDFLYTIGTTVMAEKLIKRNKVRLLIMANDHSVLFRAFKKAADGCNIPTMYLQHASVTYRFPPLQFSYSFLDGMDSFEKYYTIGNMKGDVFICGAPRFDIISKYSKKQISHFTIGVAINMLDDESEVKRLCLFLQEKGYNDIIIRPHPRMVFDYEWCLAHDIRVSDSKTELSFDFLSNISMMISGESGIHLDAALVNVRSICYNFNNDKSIKDWYSFQKHGMYPYVNNYISLLHELEKKRTNENNNEDIVPFYNASYGLPVNGHVGDLLAEFVNMFLENDVAVNQFVRKFGFVEVMPHVWCYHNYCNLFLKYIVRYV